MVGVEGPTDDSEGDWTKVGDSDGRKGKECFNCHEVGHLRQNCVNKKRIKCFNCEKLGHVKKDCEEPAVVRQKFEAASGWRDSELVRKLIASRNTATQSSSGMTVVQAYLEVDEGKLWRVKRDIGLKILEILGLEASSIVGQNKEVKGIQVRGSKVEFCLSQNTNIEKFLIEDIEENLSTCLQSS